MPRVYDLKPKFQGMLRPLTNSMAHKGITANQVTVSGDVGDISKYTSPLKLFDYMKLGKLILCSNLKVLNEVLTHQKNCILIDDYKNEKEWLKQILKVSRNIKRYNKIRRSAFEYAKKRDVIWRTSKLLSFYDYFN